MNILDANKLVTNNSYARSNSTDTIITLSSSGTSQFMNPKGGVIVTGAILSLSDFVLVQYRTLFPPKFQEELKGFDMIIETHDDFKSLFAFNVNNKLVCDSVSTPLLHEFLSDHILREKGCSLKCTDNSTIHIQYDFPATNNADEDDIIQITMVVSLTSGNIKWYVNEADVPKLALMVD